ncbi:MAG TPA: hypothetical protein VGF13_19500, partial [Verrucomicrobiae bacterium]
MLNRIQRLDDLFACKAIQSDGTKRIVTATSPNLGFIFSRSLVVQRNGVMSEQVNGRKKVQGGQSCTVAKVIAINHFR